MYLTCPNCQTVYTVRAAMLKEGQGEVRCGACHTLFNALDHLSDELPEEVGHEEPSPPEASATPPAAASVDDTLDHALDDTLDDLLDDSPLEPPDPPPADLFAKLEQESFDAEPDSVAGPDSSSDAQPVVAAEPDAALTRDAASEPEPEAPPRADSVAAPEPEPEHEREPGPELETESEREAALGSSPETAPPPERASPSEPTLSPRALSEAEIPAALSADWRSMQHDARAPRRNVGMMFLAVLLLVALAGQYVWFEPRDLVSRFPQAAGVVDHFCRYAGCILPPRSDPTRIQILNRDVRAHPRFEGALLVRATISNAAPWPQPFPRLRFRLYDVNGATIASRIFQPREYLSETPSPDAELAPAQPLQVALELLAPEETAVSFEFSFL